MNMGFRWYGEDDDAITLSHIKQIPGVSGIIWALHNKSPGEVWEPQEIQVEKKKIEQHGFRIDVVESVNVHEDIKLGLDSRDHYIANYIETIRNLAEAGVKVICYNFMPVFDWIRTELKKNMDDGSTTMFYEKERVENSSPAELVQRMTADPDMIMSGWEPERLKQLKKVMEAYAGVSKEDLRENLRYFLEKVLPVCEETGVKLAIHPDDPPWSVFSLPRIISTQEDLRTFMQLIPNEHSGITYCTGSLGAREDNDLLEILDEFKDRIYFAHIRNIKRYENGDFIETSHLEKDGSLPITEIMKKLFEMRFEGYIRPDHGRLLWKEDGRPGYGLYDRALGIMYLNGIWDANEERSIT
ncbi:D-mannonate dehydratase [Sinobaca qinghaiensis]|uniref:Mannonate dehydratase n=1 Tax=Sinobaca qinghaiensis TaxID=342944 RepID=A0A419V8N1_9BACL|nr:mannonate dehydratase [Sinobaca qinghaiensis]RKD76328.1 D-mannonate dehydratase [Sinobaca qinghaiensis]